MATSQARVEANRKNAMLSTGPRTDEGKAISCRNSLKHGLTGEGIVLPDEDVAAVEERFEALQVELAPRTSMGQVLAQRVAFLSVRLERCARQEAKSVGQKMRWAGEKFVDQRMFEVEKMMGWIAAEPDTHARRLRSTPEGVDRLIAAWADLDAALADLDAGRTRWGFGQWQRLENLEGRRPEDAPMSRDGVLCKCFWGEPEYLAPGEVEGLDAPARRDWARDRLRERIAARLVELRALRGTFDPEALARDRDEAAQRAIFDGSNEAILARKYEAAAERGLYRALKELREVEAEAARRTEHDATDDEEEDCDELASSLDGEIGEPPPAAQAARPGRSAGRERLKEGRKSSRSRRQPFP